MTKKILAVLLSVAMVVTVLPTIIFAAGESDCPVLDEHDGYDDHSKTHCDAHGVTYTQISKVEAECGQDGYTLYQCECGAYFADDIIPMDPHHTESGEPKTERVEPTCYSKGTAAIFVCDECGKDYFDPNDPDADAKGEIAMLPHTFDDISYPGNDCTAAEQVCQNEGCTAKNDKFKPCDEHSWVYNDPEFFEVVLAPTYHKEGTIKFYCTNDGCAQYKVVVIKALEPHTKGMTLVEAVEPDCDSTGNIEYWKDDVCGKLYIETLVNNTPALVEVTEEDVFLDYAHDWNVDPTIIPPTCTTWGFSYYGCPSCGAKKDFTEIKPLDHTPYACPEHEEYDAENECEICEDALLSTGHAHTAPTCLKDGEFTWICGRCQEEQSAKDPKTNHKQVTVDVPGTHLYGYSYTIVYCTNEHCDKDAVKTVTKTVGGKSVDLDVTVEVREDGNVYDMPADAELHVVEVKNVKAVSTNLKHFFVEDKEVQAPTCTDDGKAFWYCAGQNGCNTYYDEVLPATGHDYSDKENDIDATCTTNAFEVCDNDNCGYQNELENTMGHKWETEKAYTTLPTCQGGKGYDWYECAVNGCGAMDKRNEKKFVPNRTYLGREDLDLTAKEEFELEHPGFATALAAGTADYVEYTSGDCLNNGYWKATCPDCGKTYLVLIDNTGKGHKAPAGTEYNEEATCTKPQGYADYICVLCKEEIKNTNKPLGHDMTNTPAKAPNCLEDGNEEYYTCSRDCCQVNIAAAGEEEKWVPIIYKDKNGVETWDWENDEHIIPTTGHSITDTVVTVTCTTPGFVHHICTNKGCDVEYVDGYEAPLTHTKGDKEYLAPSCTTPGYENYLCGRDDCDCYYSEKVLPATGHKNAAGQIIVDKCTDTVTDRVCVNTNCPLTPNAQNKKVVPKSHDIVIETVNSGCDHYGYKMETCANGCGEKDKVTDIIEPHGHWAPWGTHIMADDMTAINENDCGYLGEDFLYHQENDIDYDGDITAYTAPTYESLGSISFICDYDDCGDEITRDVIRTGVDFIMEVENASKPGAYEDCAPSDGDVISVEITLNAYQTNIWGFNFDVSYNAAAMNFLGYTYNAGDVFANHKVNNIVKDDLIYEFDVEGRDVNGNSINDLYGTVEGASGTIKVSAYTENDINGKIQDALINGTKSVITLYFQVEATVDYTFMGVPGTEYDYDVNVDMEYYDGNGWVSSATVVNSEGEVENTADYFSFDAETMLDINYTGDVTITDLYFCNMILTGEAEVEYLASADANKDGQITITDLDLMNQLLQGADESVVYDALAWTAPDGFVAA